MNSWTAVPIGTDGYRIDGDGLCGIAFVPHDMDLARSAARAALIAAAPKLLETCEALLEDHYVFKADHQTWQCPFCVQRSMSAVDPFPHAADCPVVKARAAIAAVKPKTEPGARKGE